MIITSSKARRDRSRVEMAAVPCGLAKSFPKVLEQTGTCVIAATAFMANVITVPALPNIIGVPEQHFCIRYYAEFLDDCVQSYCTIRKQD